MGGYSSTPFVQQDLLGKYAKAVALRGMIEEQRQRGLQTQMMRQQLQDQQALTQAFQSWDPSKQSYDDLAKSAINYGASGNSALAIQQHALQVRSVASQIAKNDSETGSKNLETIINRHDQLLGALDAAKQVPDEQLGQHIFDTAQRLQREGILADPTLAQSVQQIIQLPPAQMRSQLDMFEKSLSGQKRQFENAKTQAETQASQTAAAKNQAELDYYRSLGLAPGVSPETASYGQFVQQGGQPINYPAWKAQQVSQAEAPVRIATAQAEGVARANIEAAMARGSNAALANVPPHLIQPATAAATKAGEDYANTKSVSDRMAAIMDAARNGNVLSYQIIPEEGTLQVFTSQGVHRVNRAEFEQYAGAGNLWQRLQGASGKQLSGQSIAPSVLNDMADIQNIVARGAQAKYQNTLRTINSNYGSSFKPVEMEGLPSAGGGAQAKTISMAAIQQAARDHGVSVDEARRQAQAQGYTIK